MGNIFLVGFMKLGKSKVEKLLSARLGNEFLEGEAFLTYDEKVCVIDSIVKKDNEEYKKIEDLFFERISSIENKLVEISFTSMINESTIERLKEYGTVVFLNLAKSEIKALLIEKFKNNKLSEILADDLLLDKLVNNIVSACLNHSDIIIQFQDKEPEELVEEILMLL